LDGELTQTPPVYPPPVHPPNTSHSTSISPASTNPPITPTNTTMPLITSPLSASPILPILSGLAGVVTIVMGVRAMLDPLATLAAFDLPAPADPAAAHLVRGLMLLFGVRDAAYGAALLATACWGSTRAMGVSALAGAAIAAVEVVVTGWADRGGEARYWPLVGVSLALALPALGLFDGARRTRK
jgi:hypothetical protein